MPPESVLAFHTSSKAQEHLEELLSKWADHFALKGGAIPYKTIIGEGTIRLPEFKTIELIPERTELIAAGIYP